MKDYTQFLTEKTKPRICAGFEPQHELCSALFPFQRDIVLWALRQGRAALFEDCGLGKTIQQLVWADAVHRHTGKQVLILTPLAVADQTVREGKKFGIQTEHCREQWQAEHSSIVITNYERIGKFNLPSFAGIVLDESSILKSYTGKVRNQIIEGCKDTPYRLACTATPAPNDYMELGNHAEFVGAMKRTEMLAMFFVHDGGNTQKWRLKGHAQDEFWRWVCSWAIHLRQPSTLGYEDTVFVLPEISFKHHTVVCDAVLPESTDSLSARRLARRLSLPARVAKASELANSNDEQWLVWCDLNEEGESLAKTIRGAVEIAGRHSDDQKAQAMKGFSQGEIRVLVTKPKIAGFGMNWQNSHNQVFTGLSDSYEQFYQAIRRQWRFGQQHPVNVHVVTSPLDRDVLENIQRKQTDADKLAESMSKHMAVYSTNQVHGTQWSTTPYEPKAALEIPAWLAA